MAQKGHCWDGDCRVESDRASSLLREHVEQPANNAYGTATDEQLMFKVPEAVAEGLEVDEASGEGIEGQLEDGGLDGAAVPRVRVAQ